MLDRLRTPPAAVVLPPPAPARLVETAPRAEYDPPDPWETPCAESALADYTARRLGAFPSQPASLDDLPRGARGGLEAVVGALEPADVVVIPTTPRPVGADRRAWVATPTSVLAVGDGGVALWVDGPSGAGIAAAIPFDRIAAVVDRTVLLSGRLEIVGAGASLVVRYNTVGRAEIRSLASAIRAGFWPPAPVPADDRSVPLAALSHKWAALLNSPDAQPGEPGARLVAAGVVERRPGPRNGVATLTATELLVATEPALEEGAAPYGVDLVAIPRPAVVSVDARRAGLEVAVALPGSGVRLGIPAHPSLVAAVIRTLAPHLAAG